MRAILAIFVSLGVMGAAGAQTVTLRSVVTLETREVRDQSGQLFSVGGLSGIAHVRGDEYLAVMDNSNKLVRLTIQLNSDGSIRIARAESGVSLADTMDFEGIALSGAHALLSEEQTPAIQEFRLSDGGRVRTIDPPRVFRPPNLRPNLGFESLAIHRDELWTTTEEALKCDGDRSTLTTGSIVRLLKFARRDDGSYSPAAQYAYVTEPIHKPFSDENRSMSRSGVSELLFLPNGKLVALERSFSLFGPRNVLSDFRNSLFEIDFDGAIEISSEQFANGLTGHKFVPASKKLLWSHQGNEVGNLEGICVGPELAPGKWALIGVVDNNKLPLVANRVESFELVMPEKKPGD